jgi:hypothetical protein
LLGICFLSEVFGGLSWGDKGVMGTLLMPLESYSICRTLPSQEMTLGEQMILS